MQKLVFFCFAILAIAMSGQGLSNTLELSEGVESPPATLADIDWIAGHWTGSALGGQVEEIWSPPLGGSMMGSFKLVQEEKVIFYEIITIAEIDDTLILRLKHFDSQLRGWEEKDETVDFKLVKVTPDKVFFDGLTFERINEQQINVYVIFENKGVRSEGKFNYFRQNP